MLEHCYMYKVFTHVTFFGLFKSDVSRTTSTLEMAKKCHMLDVKNYNQLLWAEVNVPDLFLKTKSYDIYIHAAFETKYFSYKGHTD